MLDNKNRTIKYIDAEKLIAEINNRLMSVNLEELGNLGCHRVWAYNDVKDLIASLQQEQVDTAGDDGKFVKILVRREFAEQIQRLGDEIQAGQSSFIEAMNQQEQPESVKGKFVFPKFLYARTLDNKTIDVSYGPQDMTAIEYVRNDFVGQQEVELEKAFAHEYAIYHLPNFIIASIVDGTELIDFIYKTARHFYELGLKARKEN